MATSGTFTWSLDIAEIIEEAYENCGLELRTGYHLKTARRSLNLLLTEWINDGVHLWTMDQVTVALTTSTQSYTLDAKYVDIIDAVTRNSSNVDVENTRITMSEYLHRPTKSTTGVPTQHTLERNSTGGHTLYVWPTATDDTYSFVGWFIRYPEDVTNDYTDNPEVPRRFVPALTLGLSHRLAIKNPKTVELEHRLDLQRMYDIAFAKARDEDRERASFYVLPSNNYG